MTFTKKIVCASFGIMGGIFLIPTFGVIGLAGAEVPIYILDKLEDTKIGEKIGQINLTNRKEYSDWKYDYPKSYAGSFFVGGIFASFASGYYFYRSYLDSKILFSSDTCCKTIRAGLFQPALILTGLIGSGFSIGMFQKS